MTDRTERQGADTGEAARAGPSNDTLETRGPWRLLDRREIYRNRWIALLHHEVLTPAGTRGIYGVVSYANLAVGIIPIDADGGTWIVGQHRFPQNRYSWEIPEGGAPVGTDPETSAHRELAEETGLRAGILVEILRLDLSNSTTDEAAIIYLAADLTAGESAPEETEELAIRRLPLSEAYAMACDGRMTDAMTVAGLLKLRLLHLEGRLPAAVGRAVARGFSGEDRPT